MPVTFAQVASADRQVNREFQISALDSKTFVAGIGAQKAGTTWLNTYFRSRDEIFVPPIKELHYFDAKHRPDICRRYDRKAVERLAFYRSKIPPDDPMALRKLDIFESRVRMISDSSAYAGYFERNVPAGCPLFGEVTPSYSILPVEGFRDMASTFKSVKLVFLMRDPVSRFHSHLRMELTRKRAVGPSLPVVFAAALKRPEFVERTFYHRTFANMRAVFAEDQIFTGFYESFFCDEEVGRLCAFLGIPFVRRPYGAVLNASPKLPLTPELEAMAREAFAPVYDFCRTEFGDSVPASWLA